MKLSLVSKRYSNNNNLNNNHITTTNREDVVAVNFKKLKEEERMSAGDSDCPERGISAGPGEYYRFLGLGSPS
jgi:hypothetical protein